MKVALVNVAFVPWMFEAISKSDVESQVKAVSPPIAVEPVQNVTWFATPLPVRLLPPIHVPSIAKQPSLISKPLTEVEVPEVTERRVVLMPAAKVEVPCPAATVIAPPKVEVAVPAAIRLPELRMLPTLRLPVMVEEPETYSALVVA